MLKFFLVGAGPGRAAILYDRLISPEVLERARPSVERMCVDFWFRKHGANHLEAGQHA